MINYIRSWIVIPYLRWMSQLYVKSLLDKEEKSIFLSREECIEAYHKYNLPTPYPDSSRDEAIERYLDNLIDGKIPLYTFAKSYVDVVNKTHRVYALRQIEQLNPYSDLCFGNCPV